MDQQIEKYEYLSTYLCRTFLIMSVSFFELSIGKKSNI